MIIYAFSGLGADKRVFTKLKLKNPLQSIEWIKPFKNESIENYALRISKSIDTAKPFCILGVSFGGLIAVEVSKLIQPNCTIIISSVEVKGELRPIYRFIGWLNVIRFIPVFLFNPPRLLANFVFGTSENKLLNNILNDTDLHFVKWAVDQMTRWNNNTRIPNLIKIGGSDDRLLPPDIDSISHLIDKGHHLMIVDRADEVSELINIRMKNV